MRSSFLGLGLGLGLATLTFVGCFTDESLVICAGSLGCDCKPDNTCAAGLACSGGRCVNSGGSGSSSSTSQSASQSSDDATTGDDGGVTPTADATSSTDDSSTPSVDASTSNDAATGSSGTNLVTNGDFSQGATGWGIVMGSAPTPTVASNELCVAAPTTLVILGWPQGMTIAPPTLSVSASYTFTYKARASQTGLMIDAKVGNTMPPNYTADFETANDAVTTSQQTFTHTFTPMQNDSSTGVAFKFTSSVAQNVCFQSVSLVQN